MQKLRNRIEDVSQAHFLADCKELYSLTFDGNPMTKDELYRSDILAALPQLQLLDDLPVKKLASKATTPDTMIDDMEKKLAAERQFINHSIKYSRIDAVENTSLSKNPVVVAMTPRLTPTDMINMAKRPSSSLGFLRPASAAGQNQTVQTARPKTPMQITPRPMSARERPSSSLGFKQNQQTTSNNLLDEQQQDTSSDLTFGSNAILCGNPTRSLRSRKMERTPRASQKETKLSDEQLLLQIMTQKLENPNPYVPKCLVLKVAIEKLWSILMMMMKILILITQVKKITWHFYQLIVISCH